MQKIEIQIAGNGYIVTFPSKDGQMTFVENEHAKMVAFIAGLTKPAQPKVANGDARTGEGQEARPEASQAVTTGTVGAEAG